jgi:hypothetical protein
MAVLLILLVAVGLAALSTAFTLYEARLARRIEMVPSSALQPEPVTRPLDFTPEVPSAIVSRRARCGCGDALETHEDGPCAGCTCSRFRYAGGLVAKAS